MNLMRMHRVSTRLIPSGGRDCRFRGIGALRSQTNQLNTVSGRDSVVCVNINTRTRKIKMENPAAVGEWFGNAIESIWPVADGSLSLRKSPCVRANCPACAAGEGHRSYVLYG